jgi:hypothetical protein
MVRGVVALLFRARVVGGSATTSSETSRVEWWTLEQVTARMETAYAVRILDGLRDDASAVRAHDGVSLLTEFPQLPHD